MKTLESKEEIKVGMELRFTELWDGEEDGRELLESGAICVDGESVVAFDIIEDSENVLNACVKVTDIY